ncbi:hypothetical protein WJX77_000181 [Trebouxia sp. C0004]
MTLDLPTAVEQPVDHLQWYPRALHGQVTNQEVCLVLVVKETRPAEVRMATTGTQVQMGLSDSTQAADREQEQQIKLKLLDYSYLQTDPSVVELPPGATARFIVVSGIADVFLKCSVPSGQKLVCFEHV